jgi:predicted DNA-binding protein with PD1-like motif
MTSPELHRLPTGSRLPEAMLDLARSRKWPSAVCSGIGGVSEVELAYYDLEQKEYQTFKVDGIVELVSLSGNLTGPKDEPFWHLHAIVADRKGKTYGGHLMSCKVALTVELAVWPMDAYRTRKFDESMGLRLLSDTTSSHD